MTILAIILGILVIALAVFSVRLLIIGAAAMKLCAVQTSALLKACKDLYSQSPSYLGENESEIVGDMAQTYYMLAQQSLRVAGMPAKFRSLMNALMDVEIKNVRARFTKKRKKAR